MRHTVITPSGQKTTGVPLRAELNDVFHDVRVAWYLALKSVGREFFGFSLGRIWFLLEPALQALTYWVLLRYIFEATGAGVSFATFFAAATFWRSHASMLVNSARIVTDSSHFAASNISLRVPFLVFLLEEMIAFGFRLAILLLFLVIAGYSLHWKIAYILYIAVVQFAFTMSLSVWLSVFGGLYKDVSRIVGHAVWLWWYCSPGLYVISRVPKDVRWLYDLNPFAKIFPALIDISTKNVATHGAALFYILVLSIVFMVPGAWLASGMRQRIYFKV